MFVGGRFVHPPPAVQMSKIAQRFVAISSLIPHISLSNVARWIISRLFFSSVNGFLLTGLCQKLKNVDKGSQRYCFGMWVNKQ